MGGKVFHYKKAGIGGRKHVKAERCTLRATAGSSGQNKPDMRRGFP